MPGNETDYKKLGFMCGLEIHQRLATKGKLFCSCSTGILEKNAEPEAKVTRFQRAVAGETGTVDLSAEFEQHKNREFSYNIFSDNTCLVDIDEEPPHELNGEALSIALAVSSALCVKMADELQPMRKAVVDGSDPSAFQRTMMLGFNGSISMNGSSIGVPSIFLEEESSGIESSAAGIVSYNTDRLGIPLIEIDTDATIPSPKAAKEIALHIGTLLRLTGRVQRGIGSIRQDVNVSIKGGARVEIKGMQDVHLIDKFIENEVARQQKLIEIKGMLLSAKARVGAAADVTHAFRNTQSGMLKKALGMGGAVFAFPLWGFKGMLGTEISPKRRLGTEISDYAKMAGVGGIMHSDEDMQKYGLGGDELAALRKQLKIGDSESFIIVAGTREQALNACMLAIGRAEFALKGIPRETRMAYDTENCTSRFMRPLPTGSRMYPETDVKPIPITDAMRKRASAEAPNLEKERKALVSMLGNRELAEQLMLSPRLRLFKELSKSSGADPEFIANVLVQKITELKRNGIGADSVSDERFSDIFNLYAKGEITKHAVEELIKIAASDDSPIPSIVKRRSLERISGKRLKELVLKEMKASNEKDQGRLRGAIMSKHRLVVDGSELNAILSKM